MGLRQARSLTFRARGVTDSVDGTNAMAGSMLALTNLVSSPQTRDQFVPRSAAVPLIDLSGSGISGAAANLPSALMTLGSVVFGMVPSDDGFDHPFCYDTQTASFIAISGVTGSNLPRTQSSAGDWTPPQMLAVTATIIIVTHVGFDGVSHFFGWIDITTPASPAWSAGNTVTHALTSVPTCVGALNGRAWYQQKNSIVFSDSLVPLTVTNASQVLTLGDNQPVTAMAGIPFLSPLTGGVIQALIAFKGAGFLWQITGDAATSNLALNAMAGTVGTEAPATICQTPKGLAYIAPDGLRILQQNGQLSDPIGDHGEGVATPFQYALFPSRMCAAFSENTLRVSVQNGYFAAQPRQEWWLDFTSKFWTGPHTCNSAVIAAIQLSLPGFISAMWGHPGFVYTQNAQPDLQSTYEEFGETLTFAWQTTLLPDSGEDGAVAIVRSDIGLSLPPGNNLTAQVIDDKLQGIGACTIVAPPTAPGSPTGAPLWGSVTWGSFIWGAQGGSFQAVDMPWPAPLVFRQASILITGTSVSGFAIGNMYWKYRQLNYQLVGLQTGMDFILDVSQLDGPDVLG